MSYSPYSQYSPNDPNCQVPTGLSSLPRVNDCNISIILLLPFLVSHLSAIASHLILGNRKFRNKLRFWDYLYLQGRPKDAKSWTPWSALAGVVMTVAQAVVSAVAVQTAGLNVSISPLTLFYLTKPRVGWVIIMLTSCIYESLTDTATDVLFQECVLGLLAIPGSILFLRIHGFGELTNGCTRADINDLYANPDNEAPAMYMFTGSVGLITCGSIFLFMGITMLWKQRFLKRHLGLLAIIPCIAAFVSAWFLWVGFDYAVDGDFCVPSSAIGILSSVSIVIPVINSLLRGWIGYPGGGY